MEDRSATATPPQEGWNASTLDQGALQRSLGYNIRQVEIFMNGLFAPMFDAHGIRPVDYCILTLLKSNDDVTQTAVAETLHVQRTNLVRSMARLEAQDLVKRVTDPADKRNQFLRLTPAGKRKLGDVDRELGDQEALWTSEFTPEEVDVMIKLLKRLYGG